VKVYRLYRIVDGDLVDELPQQLRKADHGPYSGVVGVLTHLGRAEEPAHPVGYSFEIQVSEGPRAQRIVMPMEAFIDVEDQRVSLPAPLCFIELKIVRAGLSRWESELGGENEAKMSHEPSVDLEPAPDIELDPARARGKALARARAAARAREKEREREAARAQALAKHRAFVDSFRRLWLFRDVIYVTETTPRPSEIEEVVLQIKSLHYQRDDALRRLREQVANFEAAETYATRGVIRRPLADDVKLLVWTRDGGACVRCGARTGLHFDHIIPLAKGGSDSAENIQILCQTCNLAKSDRIA
jgi:hypothetical protein